MVEFDAWYLTVVRCACLLLITVVGGCFLVCLDLRVADPRDPLLRTCYLWFVLASARLWWLLLLCICLLLCVNICCAWIQCFCFGVDWCLLVSVSAWCVMHLLHFLFIKCGATNHIVKQYETHTSLYLFVVGFVAWYLTIVWCACLLFITVVGDCFLVCLDVRVSDLRYPLLRTCVL